MSHELDLIHLLRDRTSKKNRKGKGKGCFGGNNRFLGGYNSLKVIPRSKRTKENCNEYGVILDKENNEKSK